MKIAILILLVLAAVASVLGDQTNHAVRRASLTGRHGVHNGRKQGLNPRVFGRKDRAEVNAGVDEEIGGGGDMAPRADEDMSNGGDTAPTADEEIGDGGDMAPRADEEMGVGGNTAARADEEIGVGGDMAPRADEDMGVGGDMAARADEDMGVGDDMAAGEVGDMGPSPDDPMPQTRSNTHVRAFKHLSKKHSRKFAKNHQRKAHVKHA